MSAASAVQKLVGRDKVFTVRDVHHFKQIVSEKRPIIFEWWTPWSSNCRFLTVLFRAMSARYKTVAFYIVDISAQPEIARMAGIDYAPSFSLYLNGTKEKAYSLANAYQLEELLLLADPSIPLLPRSIKVSRIAWVSAIVIFLAVIYAKK